MCVNTAVRDVGPLARWLVHVCILHDGCNYDRSAIAFQRFTIVFLHFSEGQQSPAQKPSDALLQVSYIIFPLCEGILAPPGLGPLTPNNISISRKQTDTDSPLGPLSRLVSPDPARFNPEIPVPTVAPATG